MSARPLSVECRLVFGTAGPADVAEGLDADAVDWGRVAYLAERELAESALWRALERVAPRRVPPAVADDLRRHAMLRDFRMMHLAERLGATVQAFAARGVPVLLLKGAAIGAITDPTFRARPMNDIDLLVRPADAERARAAVLAAGWPPNDAPALRDLPRDHHHLAPFYDARIPDLRLELHVALLAPGSMFDVDEDEYWRDAERAPAPFEGALVPSSEHLLLHACVHFAWSHMLQFGAWRTFRLVNALVETARIDWAAFLSLAERAGGGASCYWTLRLARRLAGVRVPDAVLGSLELPSQRWLRDVLERCFIADIATGEGPSSPSVRLSRTLWRLAMHPGAASDAAHRHRTDPRWARPGARDEPESARQRVLRHAKGIRNWWDFATRTLVPRD